MLWPVFQLYKLLYINIKYYQKKTLKFYFNAVACVELTNYPKKTTNNNYPKKLKKELLVVGGGGEEQHYHTNNRRPVISYINLLIRVL